MKLITVLVMLLGIMTFCNAQEGIVTIWLAAIELDDNDPTRGKSDHLLMYDSNNDFAINNLTTHFEQQDGIPGIIYWEKSGNTEEIIKIEPELKNDSQLFGNLTKLKDGRWMLELPQLEPGGNNIIEAYHINYKKRGGIEEYTDPYINITPPDP